MSEIPIEMVTSEEVVLTVLTHLKNGKIDHALAGFSEEFRFEDHGIGVEFTDKERLAEFSRRHENFTQTPRFRLTRFS